MAHLLWVNFENQGPTISSTIRPPPLRYLSIIRAVTEVGALWLLPVLYYRASDHTRPELRSSIALGAEEQHVQTCIGAQGDLVRWTAKVWSFLSKDAPAQCESPSHCTTSRGTMAGWFCNHVAWESNNLTPLDDWDYDDIEGSLSHLICETCFDDARECHSQLLRKV
ncbi:hypothetical protein MVEN_01954400 [Mycena venus]|uniref:Uncharacterized protein n=1 Tax=Mycena venus TaxID=2733690 RepID=A0A8H6XFY9_9AGAR|nr:hypothetical protein MVEN_01954400 [Mycena venus]